MTKNNQKITINNNTYNVKNSRKKIKQLTHLSNHGVAAVEVKGDALGIYAD